MFKKNVKIFAVYVTLKVFISLMYDMQLQIKKKKIHGSITKEKDPAKNTAKDIEDRIEDSKQNEMEMRSLKGLKLK